MNQDWQAETGDIVLMSWENDMSTSAGVGGHVGGIVNDIDFISCDYWTGGQLRTAITQHNWDAYYQATSPI